MADFPKPNQITDEGAWAVGTAYQAGDVVQYQNVYYLALRNNLGQTPAAAIGSPTLSADELGYTELTSTVLCNATTEATANTIVTAPAINFDGVTSILVEFWAPSYHAGDAPNASFYLYDGSISLGTIGSRTMITGAAMGPLYLSRRLTPSAGTHTYSIRAIVSSGGGITIDAGLAGTPGIYMPGFIRVRRANDPASGTRNITGVGTSLPASPYDGQEYILVDSLTAPTYQWRFRYMNSIAADSYKWVYLGGDPMFNEVGTGGTEGTSSTTYAALTTAGPQLTPPRAGIYDVEIGCHFQPSTSCFMSYDIGATGAVDVDSVSSVVNAGLIGGVARPRRKTLLAASTALVAKYRASTAANANFQHRWMRVTPVRVS